jgi:phosphoribosylformimino-5-aminoimidazole carboxamide ribotide isomerase
VKQLVGGSYRDGDPSTVVNFEATASAATFAEMYRRDGLTGGHVIMIGAGNEQSALDALRAYAGGLQIGGGITPENAPRFLDAGASHVILTSYLFVEGRLSRDRLDHVASAIGAQRMVLDLSCRKSSGEYRVVTDRWQHVTDVALDESTFDELGAWCAEFLVHAVDKEGKQGGIDRELVRLLAGSSIPVTYAGGVRSIEDLEEIRREGEDRVDATVGSALDIFGGPLRYRDVVEWQLQA